MARRPGRRIRYAKNVVDMWMREPIDPPYRRTPRPRLKLWVNPNYFKAPAKRAGTFGRYTPGLATTAALTHTARPWAPEQYSKTYQKSFQPELRVSACESAKSRNRKSYFAYKATGRKSMSLRSDKWKTKC